jgi:DNA-directed RNA polymerase sigma subunit (sigma70/sigma32)
LIKANAIQSWSGEVNKMEKINDLAYSDAIYYMDMVYHVKSPNFVPHFNKERPYIKMLKQKDSEEYKRFIRVYMAVRHLLLEREMSVLDVLYGITRDKATVKTVAEKMCLSSARIAQIRNSAEHKIGRLLIEKHDIKFQRN